MSDGCDGRGKGDCGDGTPKHDPADGAPLRTDLTPIIGAIAEAGADAFVAVGDRFDDGLRYLTRFCGPDRAYALVVVPVDDFAGRAVLCAPSLFREQAERDFVASARTRTDDRDFHDGVVREVRTDGVGDHAGERAAAVVCDLLADSDRDGDRDGAAESDGDRTLLVPPSIPHDAAVYLERAGNDLSSTDAVETARERKTDAEIDRLRRVQRAAVAGTARAETVLAESEVGEAEPAGETDAGRRPALRWNGGRLTTERLRREVNAVLAARGVGDAGDTVIGSGPSAADLHFVGDVPIRAGETVLLDVSPRGPDGYRGDLTRTFVVDGDGGWERRASVAVESAREAALAEIEPGATAARVHGEAAAELAAYGFDPNAGEGGVGFTHDTGHGVGVSLHEWPSLSGGAELRPGTAVAIEPGVSDPNVGGVRVADLVVVTEDGYEVLAEYPIGIVPRTR
ncbi:M24 family metallopeptidase [Halorubrum trueperi]|uniref:M24 family metallopeptidase n=1 Tax=Halorubrum trueperi TaxID=2004704 RepID=A0ABD5UI33_9EURY